MSGYVLSRVLPAPALGLGRLLARLARQSNQRLVLAEINSLMIRLSGKELAVAVASPPPLALPPHLENQVAAMVEYGCALSGIEPPSWTHSVVPLEQPVFGSELESVRLYLLAHSPAPFRRRNIFIDTSLGGQV